MDLKVISLTVGQLQANCYIVYDEKAEEGIIIDPGDDGQYICVSLIDKDITPKAILATHGHFDHVLAATEVKLTFEIPFLMNNLDEFLLNRQKETAEYFLGVMSDPPTSIDQSLQEGELKISGALKFRIIETPGHTPGSVCIAHEDEKMLFVGDLLFANRRVGEVRHKYSNPSSLSASLKKIKSEFKGYTAYPGHGEIFTI